MRSFLIVDDEDMGMKLLRAQGATQLFCGTTYRPGYCLADQTIAPLFALQKEGLRAQGATEYLVLLAVVLVIALVAIALLGFFPGMTGDAQETQSKMYWQGATPIAIVEWAAKASSGTVTYPYLLLRNTGTYPIKITAVIGADGAKANRFWGSGCGLNNTYYNLSDYYDLAPGEEKYIAPSSYYGLACNRDMSFVATSSTGNTIGGASSLCSTLASSPGTAVFKSMGFEYIEYIENLPITKRQIGKQLIIRCKV